MTGEHFLVDQIALSLEVSLAATLISVLAGTPVALILARKQFPGRSLMEGLAILPLTLPPTVLGYYLLVAMGDASPFGRIWRSLTGSPLVFTFWGIVIAAAVTSSPLYIMNAMVAFASVDRELEDAARVVGASEWTVFRRVTVPAAARGMIAGTVLSYARALGDFGATLMVGGSIPGRTRTLPLAVYDAWQQGQDRIALGLSLLLSAIALTVAVAAAYLAHQRR
ncbi:MAG: molybdate ABC transporter permease subunit [Chthonomonadales bacterium]